MISFLERRQETIKKKSLLGHLMKEGTFRIPCSKEQEKRGSWREMGPDLTEKGRNTITQTQQRDKKKPTKETTSQGEALLLIPHRCGGYDSKVYRKGEASEATSLFNERKRGGGGFDFPC